MKGLFCANCIDIRTLQVEGPVSCKCGNLTGWWVDPKIGTAQFHAHDRSNGFGVGLNNHYLIGAVELDGMAMDADWKQLHGAATRSPNHLFDASRRACWALIFKPGLTSDTSWVDSLPGNCEATAMVDFGKGEVEVRCTRTGEHRSHRLEVWWPGG